MGGDLHAGANQEGGDDVGVVVEVSWGRRDLLMGPGGCGEGRLSVCLSQVPVRGQLVLSDSAGLGGCFHLGGK